MNRCKLPDLPWWATEYWHFYFCDGEIHEAYCPECQEFQVEHSEEYPEDELILRYPEPEDSCDGCGLTMAGEDEE